MDQCVPDWSGLVGDLLGQIAIRLAKMEDFRAFRGVCTSWRAAVISMEDKYLTGRKIPMILLPEKKNGERELYSLSERRIIARIALPEARGKRWFDVGFGWVLSTAYGDVGMFKPLSRTSETIQLPKIKDFFRKHGISCIKQARLSHDPSSSDKPAVLTMTTNTTFVSFHVGRNGDVSLERSIKPAFEAPSTCCCYREIIYAVGSNGCIWATAPAQPGQITLVLQIVGGSVSFWLNYLVESTAGELLLIDRHPSKRSFSVLRIDVAKREWKRVNDLGGDAILISANLAIAVAAADYPGVLKPNCIYFTDDFWLYLEPGPTNDVGVYNIQDHSLETVDLGSTISSPPLWISL